MPYVAWQTNEQYKCGINAHKLEAKDSFDYAIYKMYF